MIFQPRREKEKREKKKVTVEKFTREAVSRDGEERRRLNRREKEEGGEKRERERVSSQVFILVHRFPRLATVYGMATCMYAK